MENPADPPDPLALEQHPAFVRALCHMGRDARSLVLEGQARALGRATLVRRPVLGRYRLSLALRGPVWSDQATLGERVDLLRRLRKDGVSLIEADQPDPALQLAGFRQVATPAHVAEIDLATSGRDRRRALHPSWRGALTKAEKAGLHVVRAPYRGDEGHWLVREEARQRQSRRYHARPVAFTPAFGQANPGQAMVFHLEENAQPVAGIMILQHGTVATYHLGWSCPRGRETAAHHLLLMAAADWLAETGHQRLDLGTVDTDGAPGLALFKIRAGACVRPLGGSWLALPWL
jgi:hypothetical protein